MTSHRLLTLPLLLVFVFAQVLPLSSARAELLFEGYYKVTQFKKHIGFLILRHEIDDKTKNFKTTSFIKLGKGGFDMTESYQAVSDGELAPLSINYLAAGDKKTKTINVTFKNQKMTGTTVEDGKTIKIDEKMPKGIFLSSALYYLMLKSKTGLKTGSTFDYSAVTEEGPVVMTGTVSVDKKMVTRGPHQLLKINNRFAGSDYDNLVSPRGEVVSAVTPSTSIESELVADKSDATAGIKIPPGMLEKIFGGVPAGTTNLFHTKGK